ncbi:DUF3426 domain-containing protein, partial [Pseudomonas sp. SIMBA_068]
LEQNRTDAASTPVVPPAPAAPAEPVAAPPVTPDPPISERPAAIEEDWALTAQALDELDLDQELARLERRGDPAAARPVKPDNGLQAR